MGSLAPAVAKRRLYAYLQRKGFSSGDISDAIAKVLG
jgi:SOS response regulatory protein OraA/RecX